MRKIEFLLLREKWLLINLLLEAISKKPFGAISLLGPRFNSSEYYSMPAG